METEKRLINVRLLSQSKIKLLLWNHQENSSTGYNGDAISINKRTIILTPLRMTKYQRPEYKVTKRTDDFDMDRRLSSGNLFSLPLWNDLAHDIKI